MCKRGDHWVRCHRSGRWLDESSFREEVGLEWVEETEGDEEVEIANIIDKSLKKFKWKWGRSKVGNSPAVCLLGARAGKRVCGRSIVTGMPET